MIFFLSIYKNVFCNKCGITATKRQLTPATCLPVGEETIRGLILQMKLTSVPIYWVEKEDQMKKLVLYH